MRSALAVRMLVRASRGYAARAVPDTPPTYAVPRVTKAGEVIMASMPEDPLAKLKLGALSFVSVCLAGDGLHTALTSEARLSTDQAQEARQSAQGWIAAAAANITFNRVAGFLVLLASIGIVPLYNGFKRRRITYFAVYCPSGDTSNLWLHLTVDGAFSRKTIKVPLHYASVSALKTPSPVLDNNGEYAVALKGNTGHFVLDKKAVLDKLSMWQLFNIERVPAESNVWRRVKWPEVNRKT
eukprot:TRINITY_DN53733_c0_g1_i1.p1 TRINITY_DN53733_c0_g1~~TRINITY_DN53733_c0_g1_i1.p1  ORF type:complete len:240 (+),score=37.20 TRINITY_DN53733_c0_g1_i1:16-735(+)